MNDLQKQIDDLAKEVDALKNRRLYQMDYTPDSVKQRAMGEGNRFVRSGTSAKLPTLGETVNTNSSAAYFETDTKKWKISTGGIWYSTTLS